MGQKDRPGTIKRLYDQKIACSIIKFRIISLSLVVYTGMRRNMKIRDRDIKSFRIYVIYTNLIYSEFIGIHGRSYYLRIGFNKYFPLL